MPWPLLADMVLVIHFGVLVFNVGGLLLIWIGNLAGWRWVNYLRFRVLHAGAIAYIVAKAWAGEACPLTMLEAWLREQAHQESYRGSFIEYWLQSLLFFNAPDWVFLLGYTLFGLLVLAIWLLFPPRRRKH